MADLNINATTTTSLASAVEDYSVDLGNLDKPTGNKETYWDFPNASKHLGYYKSIPELKTAIDSLAIWSVGKGIETDAITQVVLEHIIGWGEDSYQSVFENLLIQKKIFGDAFAEIIRDEKSGKLLNLKPLYAGDMRVVVNNQGMIIRYEQRVPNGEPMKLEPKQVLHLCNDRIANEIHGTSVIESCQWVIDARNEALTDHRKVIHRNLVPVRIIEIDTDNTTKRDLLITEYQNAIAKGEVLVIPKGTVDIKDNTISVQDPIAWITYLENFFYQAVGVPRVIATSQEYSEASSKIGYLTFEPRYTREQTLFEQDLWNKLGLKVKFNRPVSIGGFLQDSESKNTGQVGFQPNDVQASLNRQ